MNCKHKDIIAIEESTGEKVFYCKLFEERVPDYKCNKCMMKIEDNKVDNKQIADIFGQIFGNG